MKVELKNCFEGLKEIEDNTVGLCLTDPPYFFDKLGKNWKPDAERTVKTAVASLPSGMKFDSKQGRDFYEFYLPISKEIYRVLKPGGWFLSFSAARLYHRMASAIDDAGFEVRDMMGWLYPTGQAKAFSQDHIIEQNKFLTSEQKEQLKITLKGWKTPQLRPCIEPICFAQKPREGTFVENWVKYQIGLINTGQVLENGKTPTNIVTSEHIDTEYDSLFLVQKPKDKDSFNTHPTVKPLSICCHLINLLTIPGELVLDPFIGSGTTIVAAKILGRDYIGFDLVEEYVDITNKRLESVK